MAGPDERATFCRICVAACGLLVTVEDDCVMKIKGDPDHPTSRGYTCSKGRALGAWHHSPRRLDQPGLRGRDAGWDEVLADLGAGLSAVVAETGPDAVALYLATGLAYDAAGQVAAVGWLRSVGSSSFVTAATVDNAPVLVAAELIAGNSQLAPVWDPESPGLLLLVGTNPVVSHGYGTALPDPVRRLRDFRRTGGRVWVVDPVRTESAALADHHLSVRPGADALVLAAVARALIPESPTGEWCVARNVDPADVRALRGALATCTVERAAAAADVPARDIQALVEDVAAHEGRVAVLCGTGTTMAADGILTEWMRWCVLALSNSLDVPGGMRFNRGAVSRLRPPKHPAAHPVAHPATHPTAHPAAHPTAPGRVAGQLPAVALADEIDAGRIRALVVTGGNPISAFPEPERIREALSRLEILAVVDVMDGEVTEMATHVLPATGQLERADVTLAESFAVRSAVQATPAVVAPGAGRRPVWWILASLARAMGGDLLGGASPDDLTDELFLAGLFARSPFEAADVFAAGPHGLAVPVEHGWVRETMLPDGVFRIAPPVLVERLAGHHGPGPGLVLVPRREMAWVNSVPYAGDGGEPTVRAHPSMGTGSTISSAHGDLDVDIEPDERVRPGVVSVGHGRRGRTPGRLTSLTEGVDPLTAMPHASGLPISLT